ncbi:MAG: polysaccharide pyruvyl transferase family protein [Rhodomicrobiaceae bacterium]
MNIVIFNVKYSANLGDGVIAECLEAAIARRTGWQVASIDLAGRTGWTNGAGGRMRRLKLAVLQAMPRPMRDASVSLVLGRTVREKLQPLWRERLQSADAAVFGGGQLIQDGDLNFPIKLSAAGAEVRRRGIPAAIFAVGAAPSKSGRGRALFETFFRDTNIVHAAARDEASRNALRSLGCDAGLCRDPGLLAAQIWPVQPRASKARARIGLGITHPVVLSHHASRKLHHTTDTALALYETMATRLAAAGNDVVCFTNGAAEDEALLRKLGARAAMRSAAIEIAPRANRPKELARRIANCDALIAHRLHAAIVAYSYRVPSIGLRWDDKLLGFFDSIDYSGRTAEFDEATAGRIDTLVRQIMNEGVALERHTQIIQDTEAGIDNLIAKLASDADAQPDAARVEAVAG